MSCEPFEDSGAFQESLSKWMGINSGFLSSFNDNLDLSYLDLHTAASIGENEVVRDILDEKQMEVNLLNKGGWSALMYASYMGHSETIQCLLETGADPNQRTPEGCTPLILAAMCGYDTVMGYLLRKGGDIEAKDNKGWTALFHAVSSGHQQTTDFLIKAGANLGIVEPAQQLTPIMEAAASGHEGIVLQLLNQHVDIACTDSNGNDAHALACLYGHVEIAQLIEDSTFEGRGTYPEQKNRVYSKKTNPTNSYGSSGPSIHAGPREFAKITGIGADGKPKLNSANSTLWQESSHPSHERHFESAWKGPKDLAALLDEIGCSKHLALFKEQDIDLRIFLTLCEADLKEIGIKLFGPRRKMVAAIARLNSSIKANLSDEHELAYCDSLQLKLRDLEGQLKESHQKHSDNLALLAQERQLRTAAEGFLMEQKELKSALHRCMNKLSREHQHLMSATDSMKLFHGKTNQGRGSHVGHRHVAVPSNSGWEPSEDFYSALRRSAEYVLEMQQILQTLSSTTLSPSHN